MQDPGWSLAKLVLRRWSLVSEAMARVAKHWPLTFAFLSLMAGGMAERDPFRGLPLGKQQTEQEMSHARRCFINRVWHVHGAGP